MRKPIIIFVGLYNKDGKEAFDSSTFSGKVIDLIIDKLDYDDFEVYAKTNLCDVDYFPSDYYELGVHAKQWHIRNPGVKQDDIIVLVGSAVQSNFERRNCGKIVCLSHPAQEGGAIKVSEYVDRAVRKILGAAAVLKQEAAGEN